MGVHKNVISALAGIFILVVSLVSCEEELDTIGDGVIAGEPFNADKAEFDVFAFNKRINAVQTNKLPLYQLGTYNDPIYGTREAQITAQLTLPNLQGNPTFGDSSQATEDGSETDDDDNTIEENETVKEVILYLPYQLVPDTNRDNDNDGVQDELDIDPEDANSDTDGDGVTDNEERVLGSNPLDANEDGSDDDFVPNNFPINFALDSIFSNSIPQREIIGTTFGFKVERSTFFLRDLDPNSNFLEAQEYYSTQQFAPDFVGEVLADTTVTISSLEYLFFEEDDPDTEDVDESEVIEGRLNPGVRIKLNSQFFQENILDKEGNTELLSQVNFSDFIRGLHFTLTPPTGQDLMVLFDISQANITVTYEFDDFITDDSDGETSGVQRVERDFTLNLFQNINGVTNGNAVNIFIDESLPPEIENSLDNEENASRLYLKGGSGSYAEINLFELDNGTDVISEIKANNWVINEANMVFYVDRSLITSESNATEPPRLYLFNTETLEPLFDSGLFSSAQGQALLNANYDGLIETNDDGEGIKYTIRLTEYINDIIVRDAENVTLGLTLSSNIAITGFLEAQTNDENNFNLPVTATMNPLGTSLFGSSVDADDEDKKLKLEIFYTEAN